MMGAAGASLGVERRGESHEQLACDEPHAAVGLGAGEHVGRETLFSKSAHGTR